MSKKRYVETNFWNDGYISDLDPSEKLLFLYLLTNPNTNISGVYEITLKRIAFDTGFDKDMVDKMLKRFYDDGRIVYRNDWLLLKNFLKHQSCGSKTVRIGVIENISKAPGWVLDEIGEIIQPIYSLYTAEGGTIYLNLDLNLNPDLNLTREALS